MGANTGEVWCMSADGECYWETECKTIEEAIDEGLRQYLKAKRGIDTDCFPKDMSPMCIDDGEFYIGTKTEFEPRIDELDVIERLQDQACDLCGEWAECYLEGLTKEDTDALQDQLQQSFDTWANEHHAEPTFFTVMDARCVRVADYKERLAKMQTTFGTDGTATERLC